MVKKECDNCGNKFRKLTVFHGQFLCFRCLKAKETPIPLYKINRLCSSYNVVLHLAAEELEFFKKRSTALGMCKNEYIRELLRIDMDNESKSQTKQEEVV